MSAAADIGPLRSAAHGNDSAVTSEEIAAAAGLSEIWRGYLTTLLQTAAALAALALAFFVYHRAYAPVPTRFATVDLTDVVAVREMQAMLEAARSGGDPQASLRAATQWPQELERSLAAIQADCQCVLLVRAAVIGQQLTDVTPVLKQRLGLDRLDVAELRRTLGTTVFAGPREAASQATPSPAMFPNALSLPPPAAPR